MIKFNLKKFLTAILLLTIVSVVNAGEFWTRVPSPTHLNLKNVFFLNNNTGWISGDSGFIARTTNGGTNWQVQNTQIDNHIYSIFFLNENTGWASAWELFPDSSEFHGTILLKTVNGGNTWTHSMFSDTDRYIKTIYFHDANKGFMGGAPLTLVYTTNGGASWSKADTDSTLFLGLPVEYITFHDNMTGYASGGFRDIAGIMWVTTNGGFNWRATIVGPEPLNDLFIFDAENVISAGGDFEYGSSVVVTTNQGAKWTYDTLGTFGVASGIDFRTPTNGWVALGIAQKMSFTEDGGTVWRHIFSPDSIPIFDIDFTDSTHGWGVGYFGAIIKYNGGTTSVINPISAIPDEFTLYQNYPNPFNPSTRIIFNIPKEGFVSLKVYDVSGKVISTLINKKLETGLHEIDFDGSLLASGIYYNELTYEQQKRTNKMLLLK